MQAQAYEGYFKNGNFFAAGRAIHIPEKKRVYITILDETVTEETVDKVHVDSLGDIFARINACDDEMPDKFERVKFNREFKL